MNWEQFVNQFSQFFFNFLEELDKIINQIFQLGVIEHLIALLKAFGKILLAIFEGIVKVLKFLVK